MSDPSIVVKIGTSSLTAADGTVDAGVIRRIAAQVAELRAADRDVVIVTSGAIAAGLPKLGFVGGERPSDAVSLQAASAIGQPLLSKTWDDALAEHGIVTAQILLAPHNFGDRTQYLHARATLTKLLELGVVPLINENDAVTDDEVRYGDNDLIAALVANMVDAELLLLLTDTDGVLDEDPRTNPDASLIEEIPLIDGEVLETAGGAGTDRGSGGMTSKLLAAQIASWSGVRSVIANAKRSKVLLGAVEGHDVGTSIPSGPSRMSARKLWLAFAAPHGARVVVDDGAVSALAAGGCSLLAAGVMRYEGEFDRRDVVEVTDTDGTSIGKGITRMSKAELARVAGLSGAELDDDQQRIVVHADDLVSLAGLDDLD